MGLENKDFENINKDFNKHKKTQEKLSALNTKIEQLKQDIEEAKANIQIYEAEKNKAVLKKDDTAKDAAQKNIDNEKKNIETAKAQLAKIEDSIKKAKEKVDGCIEKLSEDPEFKKYVDIVMQKKLLRRSKKALEENGMLEQLKTLIENHPNIKNNIVGMKNADIERKKLEDELSKLDSVKDAARITQIKADLKTLAQKYSKNEQNVMNCANKDKIEISKESLKRFISDTAFKIDKGTKEWNIDATINNKIKGNLKTIRNDEIALSKITGKEIRTVVENESTTQTQGMNVRVECKDNLPAPKENLKWYQFIKRFKNWRQNRKNEVEIPTEENTKDNEDKLKQKDSGEFKNSLKYDVVKEYVARHEKELYNDAKTKRKAKTNTNEEEQKEEEVEL